MVLNQGSLKLAERNETKARKGELQNAYSLGRNLQLGGGKSPSADESRRKNAHGDSSNGRPLNH